MAIDIETGQEIEWRVFTPLAKMERTNAAPEAEHFEVNDIAEEMAAFDKLPSRLRLWLDSGPKKYSALQIYGLWVRGIFIDTTR